MNLVPNYFGGNFDYKSGLDRETKRMESDDGEVERYGLNTLSKQDVIGLASFHGVAGVFENPPPILQSFMETKNPQHTGKERRPRHRGNLVDGPKAMLGAIPARPSTTTGLVRGHSSLHNSFAKGKNKWRAREKDLEQYVEEGKLGVPCRIPHRNTMIIEYPNPISGYTPESKALDHSRYPLSAAASPIECGDGDNKSHANPLCVKCGRQADKELTRYRKARAIGFNRVFKLTRRKHRNELAIVLARSVFGALKSFTRSMKQKRLHADICYRMQIRERQRAVLRDWRSKVIRNVVEDLKSRMSILVTQRRDLEEKLLALDEAHQ